MTHQNPSTILIAEDEARLRSLIRDYLKREGYTVLEASNGLEAVMQFNTCREAIDLMILDVMMPVMKGWEVCREVRQTSDVPVLFLTALGDLHDELQGFDLGADDYITKPFEYEVLMARVKALLKRRQGNAQERFQVDDLTVDALSRAVCLAGQPVELAPKEYELLVFLLKNRNIAMDRDRILDGVWGTDYYGDKRTVDTHIKNLRAKIGAAGDRIRTVRGLGYRMEG